MVPFQQPDAGEAEPFFPDTAEVPESKRHLELRTLLYLVLGTFRYEHSIGCDQFVYWDPTDPASCVAPDAFVHLSVPDSDFRSWKTWERGIPELAVEIVSYSDAPSAPWDVKLQRYQELGVQELVRFDPEGTPERRLRIWDRIGGELVERKNADRFCNVLNLYWVVAPARNVSAALRLARDAEGRDLVPTPEEAEAKARVDEAKAREAEAKAREAEAKAREAAERRVAELEALLRLQKD